jgi:hypothetical protein
LFFNFLDSNLEEKNSAPNYSNQNLTSVCS